MSVTEAKVNTCKLKAEEKDSTNKPCIDFQPGGRWQIQEEDNQAEQENIPNATSNDLNHTNGRRSKRLLSSKSNDSSVVNGDSNDYSSDSEMKAKLDTQSNKCDLSDSESKEGNGKCKRPLEDLEVDNTDAVEAKKIKLNSDQNDSSNVSPAAENSSDASNASCDLQDSSVSEMCNDLNKSAVDLNNSVKEIANDEISELNKKESNGIENKKVGEKELNEEKDKIAVKDLPDDSQKDKDIEVININDDGKKSDDESDSEVQIISLDGPKSAEVAFPIPTSLDVTSTAGYPYYNSLKEAIPNFKAGEYKPVKFPHTGTLLLEDNEVIIESPSLLVPLLIKEADKFPKLEGEEKKLDGDNLNVNRPNIAPKRNFFQSSVGQFLINLGTSRVQEWYHRDMKRSKLRQLKSKKSTEEDLEKAIETHDKRHNELKQINAIFSFRMKQCKFCGFKSESAIVMEGHYLIPHLSPRREFKCNFCMYLSRTIDAIVFHYEALHQKKAVIESTIPFHECIFCSFQSHLKTKVTAHMNRCRKHFYPSQNLSPPFDFEFPGVTTKPVTIADVIGHRRLLLSSAKNRLSMPEDNANSAYARKKLASVLSKISSQNPYPDMKNPSIVKQLMSSQPNLPPLSSSGSIQLPPGIVITRPTGGQPIQQIRPGSRYPPPRPLTNIRPIPGPRRYSPNITTAASHLASSGISITPVTRPGAVTPRPSSLPGVKNVTLTPIGVTPNRNVQGPRPGPLTLLNVAGSSGLMGQPQAKFPINMNIRPLRPAAPYQRLSTPPSQVVKGSSGNTFVVCEICDSYVKDLEELRTHMNWVHKVKIHPKMLVSRPPLNCQKCQWRFFTDQGLERHLLGAHGLVTTNMQELANKNQDGGRCIICAAVFTYKLVSHMTQVHKVTLKPAHLSYKCTVCTATFTLYRLFESHVYNVHSGSAKRSAEDSSAAEPPPKKLAPYAGPRKCKECGFVTENLHGHIVAKHMKKCEVKLCRIERCKKCLYSSDEMIIIRMSDFGLDSDIDDSDDEDDGDDDSSEESAGSKSKDEEKSKG